MNHTDGQDREPNMTRVMFEVACASRAIPSTVATLSHRNSDTVAGPANAGVERGAAIQEKALFAKTLDAALDAVPLPLPGATKAPGTPPSKPSN